jgi:putative ABC transport system permease protein
VPGGLPAFGEVGLDWPVLLFSAGITVAAGLAFGLVPARFATRDDLASALQGRGADGTGGAVLGGRLRHTFVAIQLALCIVLLVGAALLTRSFLRMQGEQLGFDPDHVITAEFRLPAARYTNDTVIAAFTEQALARIRAVPGVRSAALLGSVPLSGNWGATSYLPEGRTPPADNVLPTTQINQVTDGFFGTMGITLTQGRDFTAEDRMGSTPVVIVNRELAREAWPGESPLGKRLKIVGPPDVVATVVGVAATIKQFTLTEPPGAQLYLAKAQSPGIFSSVAARTAGDPDATGNAVRDAIWAVDRDQPVWKIRSMQSLLERDLAPHRFTALLAGSFALLALLLALIGVYGVMAYAVAQRSREIGIRMALGAAPEAVLAMVLRNAMGMALGGILVGAAAAAFATRLMSGMLYGVGATDPLTFVAVSVILAGVACLASYLPARRATRVDPMVVLRYE